MEENALGVMKNRFGGKLREVMIYKNKYGFFMQWDRELSKKEKRQLKNNPYYIFKEETK